MNQDKSLIIVLRFRYHIDEISKYDLNYQKAAWNIDIGIFRGKRMLLYLNVENCTKYRHHKKIKDKESYVWYR